MLIGECIGHNIEERVPSREGKIQLVFFEKGNGQTIGLKRKKGRCIKNKVEFPDIFLGVNIQIDKEMEASDLILVGKARGRHYSANYITEWISNA